MTRRWEPASGGSLWMGAYGGSEAHWATHQKRGYEYRWMTACRLLVNLSHFHRYGSGLDPRSGGSHYDGRPKCKTCAARRAAMETEQR